MHNVQTYHARTFVSMCPIQISKQQQTTRGGTMHTVQFLN